MDDVDAAVTDAGIQSSFSTALSALYELLHSADARCHRKLDSLAARIFGVDDVTPSVSIQRLMDNAADVVAVADIQWPFSLVLPTLYKLLQTAHGHSYSKLDPLIGRLLGADDAKQLASLQEQITDTADVATAAQVQ